mmetsp:Transcript_10496/g.18022  ORF Transcript_10496/g.18022 Transcript_10496/m.18022 type:complete len:260 (+) Transcript_10496:635-1414(+)
MALITGVTPMVLELFGAALSFLVNDFSCLTGVVGADNAVIVAVCSEGFDATASCTAEDGSFFLSCITSKSESNSSSLFRSNISSSSFGFSRLTAMLQADMDADVDSQMEGDRVPLVTVSSFADADAIERLEFCAWSVLLFPALTPVGSFTAPPVVCCFSVGIGGIGGNDDLYIVKMDDGFLLAVALGITGGFGVCSTVPIGFGSREYGSGTSDSLVGLPGSEANRNELETSSSSSMMRPTPSDSAACTASGFFDSRFII